MLEKSKLWYESSTIEMLFSPERKAETYSLQIELRFKKVHDKPYQSEYPKWVLQTFLHFLVIFPVLNIYK